MSKRNQNKKNGNLHFTEKLPPYFHKKSQKGFPEKYVGRFDLEDVKNLLERVHVAEKEADLAGQE